jgi:hypothetical protein
VLSAVSSGKTAAYWRRTGALLRADAMLNSARVSVLEDLLAGEKPRLACDPQVSLQDLARDPLDAAFYSYIAQAGYIAVSDPMPSEIPGEFTVEASLPNKEVEGAWRRLVADARFRGSHGLGALLDGWRDTEALARGLEAFVSDRFSFYDLASPGDERAMNTEAAYHQLLLGMLAMQADNDRFSWGARLSGPVEPESNREAGDGRFDIRYDRGDAVFIFELKYAGSEKDMEKLAQEALHQIAEKRYYAGSPPEKETVRVGMALHGKRCAVRCALGRG